MKFFVIVVIGAFLQVSSGRPEGPEITPKINLNLLAIEENHHTDLFIAGVDEAFKIFLHEMENIKEVNEAVTEKFQTYINTTREHQEKLVEAVLNFQQSTLGTGYSYLNSTIVAARDSLKLSLARLRKPISDTIRKIDAYTKKMTDCCTQTGKCNPDAATFKHLQNCVPQYIGQLEDVIYGQIRLIQYVKVYIKSVPALVETCFTSNRNESNPVMTVSERAKIIVCLGELSAKNGIETGTRSYQLSSANKDGEQILPEIESFFEKCYQSQTEKLNKFFVSKGLDLTQCNNL